MRWTIRIKVVAMAAVMAGAIGTVALLGIFATSQALEFSTVDLPLAVSAADGAMESRISMLEELWGAVRVAQQASEQSVAEGKARMEESAKEFAAAMARLEETGALQPAVIAEARARYADFGKAVQTAIDVRRGVDASMAAVDGQTESLVERAIADGAPAALVHTVWKFTMAANDFAFTGLADAKQLYDALRPTVADGLEGRPAIAADARSFLAAVDDLVKERQVWSTASAAVDTSAVALDVALAVAEGGDPARGIVGASDFLAGHVADFDGEVKSSRLWQIVLSLAATVVGVFFALVVGGGIAKRTVVLRTRVDDIAKGEGDLTARLAVDSKDELGDLAVSFNAFIEKIHEMVKQIADTASHLTGSAESLSSTSTQLSSGAQTVSTLTSEADTAVQSVLQRISIVAGAIEQTSTNVSQTAAATEQISHGVTSVAAGAEEMSSNITTVAAAVEELSASLAEVAGNSAESAAAGRQSATKARDAAERISTLAEAAKRIGKVIQLIEDIADQTNLLALNATIEAASAGDAGRGFTVVASEIKELAAQTARATDEIAQEVDAIQKATLGAVERIREVTEDAERVDHLAAIIAAAVEEQSATTGEVSSNVASGARAASDVSHSVSEISRGVEDVARQSSEIATGASEISANSTEAVSAANSVASAITHVRAAASETATAAGDVARVAAEGMQLATALSQLVGQFRI